jgi:hypothetical protein
MVIAARMTRIGMFGIPVEVTNKFFSMQAGIFRKASLGSRSAAVVPMAAPRHPEYLKE